MIIRSYYGLGCEMWDLSQLSELFTIIQDLHVILGYLALQGGLFYACLPTMILL